MVLWNKNISGTLLHLKSVLSHLWDLSQMCGANPMLHEVGSTLTRDVNVHLKTCCANALKTASYHALEATSGRATKQTANLLQEYSSYYTRL
jgi:hypothetical protein